MKKIRWAGIVHNILLLKNFTLEHLKAISCDRGVDEVVSELVADSFLRLEPEKESCHLTSDIEKRFELLKKVREIERKR